MNRLRSLLPLLALATIYASGQTVIPPAPLGPTINGVKIMKSGFDPATKTLKLVFMNDRAADITAYHYCFQVISTDPKQTREECKLVDALASVLETKAEEKARPGLAEITVLGPNQNFVHPGEERKIEERIGYNETIYNGSISIDAIAWSDDTFAGSAQIIIDERTAELQERQFVSRTIKNALSDGQEPTVTSVIAALRQEQQEADKDHCLVCSLKRSHVLMGAIDDLQQPGRHVGDMREFVPDNQREFLKQFLAQHDSLSEEHAKHISLRRADEQ